MSISSMRCGLLALTALLASGCYSGGRWTMPDLAFWKANPFSSSTKSAPPESVPRPSQLASQPLPAPGAGYTPSTQATAGTTAPAYSALPATSMGQPYAAAQSSAGGSTNPYVAPQQGYYTADAGANTAASYPVTNPYAPSTPAAGLAQSPPSYGSSPYGASGANGSSTPFGATPGAAAPQQNYGTPAGGAAGYVAANPTGPYANPVRDNRQSEYENRLADYRSTAGPYGSQIPDYRNAANAGNQPANDYRNAPSGYQSPESAPQGSMPPTQPQGAPYAQGGYGSPAVQTAGLYDQPASGYSPGNTGYSPGNTGYSPGNTGYSPPGTPSYQSPAGTNPYQSPAAATDAGYSPGSVSRYDASY
ncbi:MAG: hypothetical protein U1E05_05315 [Patescibacteria group bacterium]|nr:hypothetical protein [Patescibacteria group bacterium]